MQGKVICIRLNIEKLTDRKVDEILSGLPNRRKSEFIRNAILAYWDNDNMLKLMETAIANAIDGRDVGKKIEKNENGKIDRDVLEFLKSL